MTLGVRVTAIVPTRSRPESLERTIAALDRQTLGDELEVIVVQDGGPAELETVVGRSPHARLVRQAPSGPGVARNRGAAEARGAILCFTDDDCEPAPDWAEHLTAAVADGAPAALGQTLNADPKDRLGATSQLVVNELAAHSRMRGEAPFGPSSNFACRRDVFLRVPFDPAYRFAGGDRDWCAHMHRAGYELAWEPSAVVRHHQQLTPKRFWRQHVAWGRGSYRYRRRRGSVFRLEYPSFYVRLFGEARKRGRAVTALTIVSQLAAVTGYVREAGAELAARSVSSRVSERGSVSSPASKS